MKIKFYALQTNQAYLVAGRQHFKELFGGKSSFLFRMASFIHFKMQSPTGVTDAFRDSYFNITHGRNFNKPAVISNKPVVPRKQMARNISAGCPLWYY